MRGPLELICRTGERAAALTRQLLAFSRRQVLQPRTLDLNAIVTDMDKMLQRLIREDITLTIAPSPALNPVRADPGQLEQVLMNLVVNARDAMPKGGKLAIETANVELDEVFCWTHEHARPGRYVRLTVSDTGCGMDDRVKAHLFEPFFTTKGKQEGTGLGLATVLGIVKQSGGYIQVESEVAKGTRFRIYLPQSEGDAEAPNAEPATATVPGGDETILLVEDVDAVRDVVRDLLAMNGYTVLTAQHGHEALELAEEHKGPIQLLLTDVVMPEMSGPDLAQRLLRLRPETKVLFMSGYTDHAAAGQSLSGSNCVQKPVASDDLARKLREVLDCGNLRYRSQSGSG
jgi:CheY-like chemotaxis protein